MIADVLPVVDIEVFLDVIACEQCLEDAAMLSRVSTGLRENRDRARAGVRLYILFDPFEDLVAHGDHLQSSQVD